MSVEKILQENKNIMEGTSVKLSKPLMVNGDAIDTIPYDFNTIIAKDRILIERELKGKGVITIMPQSDDEFLINLFAKAVSKVNTTITLGDLMRLGFKDFVKITGLTRNFFYREPKEELIEGESFNTALEFQE